MWEKLRQAVANSLDHVQWRMGMTMDKAYQLEFLASATRLLKRLQTERALAARLKNDPGKAIAEEAGCPLPEGVRVVARVAADGKSFHLKPIMAALSLQLLARGCSNARPYFIW